MIFQAATPWDLMFILSNVQLLTPTLYVISAGLRQGNTDIIGQRERNITNEGTHPHDHIIIPSFRQSSDRELYIAVWRFQLDETGSHTSWAPEGSDQTARPGLEPATRCCSGEKETVVASP